jgi:hypothetical protein
MARRLLLLAFWLCGACIAAELRYPAPPGAKDQRHVRLSDTGGEQDYFVIMYYSEGSQHRARPDSDTQRVVLIEYEVPDGKAAAEYLGYKCNGA